MSSNETTTTASKENDEVKSPGGNGPSIGDKNEDQNTFGGDGGGDGNATPALSFGSGDNSPATGNVSFGNEGTGSSSGFGGNSGGGFGFAATGSEPEDHNSNSKSSGGFDFNGSYTTSVAWSVPSADGGSNPEANVPSTTGGFDTASDGGFGSTQSNTTSAFGGSMNGGGSGAANGGGFGSDQDNNISAFGSNFGTITVAPTTTAPSGFGGDGGGTFGGGNMFSATTPGAFGASNMSNNQPLGKPAATGGGFDFGGSTAAKPTGSPNNNMFGVPATPTTTTMSPSGFGGGGMFGGGSGTDTGGGNMFGGTNFGTFVCCYFLLLSLIISHF